MTANVGDPRPGAAALGQGDRIDELTERTIQDFGDQWRRYPKIHDLWVDPALLQDICGPLLDLSEVRGKRTAEVGAGSGRIVRMLLTSGAEHVVAVEPAAEAVATLRQNTLDVADQVTLIQGRGEALPPTGDLDHVFIIGTIQHIPQPAPVIRAAFEALRSGGKIVVWLYSVEGNGVFLAFVRTLRTLVRPLPYRVLYPLCGGIRRLLDVYMFGCRFLPLPLRSYVQETLGQMDADQRKVTIYDQLNPTFVKYYTRDELTRLLEQAGFADVRLHHRRHYSWSAVGVKRD